jgi:N-ethylmaleimide reductase
VVLAPLTRMRASLPGNVPNALNAEYYAQRASPGGLLVAEATQVCPEGQGYPQTPGIHSKKQVAGWRLVTDAVHARGGLILLQLWHVGRISHSSLQPGGALPIAPSAIKPAGSAMKPDFSQVPFETPRALELREITDLVEQYRKAGELAKEAGFDGVEIHSANGYLIDQFLRDRTNQRQDAYGGSIPNRLRFLREVTGALVSVWGADRVGVRLSPFGSFSDISDSDPHRPVHRGPQGALKLRPRLRSPY